MIGFGRRIFLVPMPRFESFEALNAWLEEQCLKLQDAVLRGLAETNGERMLRDLDALMALPPALFGACEKLSTRATSISMVRYRGNDYSVPVGWSYSKFCIVIAKQKADTDCRYRSLAVSVSYLQGCHVLGLF